MGSTTAALALAIGGLALLPAVASATVSPHQPENSGLTFYVDDNGTGDVCTQAQPCDSIGYALELASDSEASCEQPVTIQVGAGTFYEGEDVAGSYDNDTCYGSYSNKVPYIIVDGIPGQTFVVGDDSNYFVENECGSLTLEGLTIAEYNDEAVYNACGRLTIENDTFEDESEGVYSSDDLGWTTTDVSNSTFEDMGTGVYNDGNKADVSNSTFMYLGLGFGADYGENSIENSTFSRLSTGIENDGTDIYAEFDTIDQTYVGLSYGTIEGPISPSVVGETDVFASIVTNGEDDNCYGGDPVDEGYNVTSYNDCGFSTGEDDSVYTDPELGALQNNGGYTWTEAVLPTSVAYQSVPGDDCLPTDQRGEVRNTTTGWCSAGAYEWSAPVALQFLTTPITGPTSDGANNGDVEVQMVDADGLPAVSSHLVQLNLSTTATTSQFSLTDMGEWTTSVGIPTGSTWGSFYFGDYHPQTFPIMVCGWDAITSLGCINQTETVVTGPGVTITKTAGDSQTTDVGTIFSTDLAVNVVDGTDNPVEGESVTFTVDTGGATFGGESSATVTTDANGNAVAPALTAGTVPNDDVEIDVTTSPDDLSTSFTEAQTVGPPAILLLDDGSNQSAVSDQTFGTDLATTLTDQYGNPIEGATVDYTVVSGSSTFTSGVTDSEVTDVNGDTTATTLTAGDHGGTQTITATVEDTSVSSTFSGITVTPKSSNLTISIFGLGQSTLTAGLKTEIMSAAHTIAKYGNTSVTLDGYADDSGSKALNISLSLARGNAVKTQLAADLKALHVGGVSITVVAKGASNFINGNGKLPANRRVTAALS